MLSDLRPYECGCTGSEGHPAPFCESSSGAQRDEKNWTGRIDVLVFTTGGDTLAAFGLARLLRESADWVGALVPDKCHSAGTLFSLGADEVFMCNAGTLSPIDPALVTPLNPTAEGPIPGQRQLVQVSVESVAGFKALVEEWGLKENGAVEAFKILAERVHPLALGDVYRSRQQIERLARTSWSSIDPAT